MSTSDYLSDVLLEAARDEIAPDTFSVESFADWLYGECMSKHPVDLPPQFRSELTQQDFSRKDVPNILAFASDRGQRRLNRLAAFDCLLERFEQQQAAEKKEKKEKKQPTNTEQVEAQLRAVVAPESILFPLR